LHDDANRGEKKRTDTEDGSENARRRAAGLSQHRLNGLRSGFTEHVLDRRHHLRGDRIVAEKQAGHSDGDYDNGAK
jgi:hypothetical protein